MTSTNYLAHLEIARKKVNHKNLVQILIKENMGNELVQAILKIYQTNFVAIKIFWIFCLIVNVGFCGYLTIQTIMAYFSYDTYTSSKTYFETPSQFPMITLCKFSKFLIY
jgi:hypothetical protein